jgi:DNA repair exonuclease SbcCD nuclease subunit
MGLKGIVSSDFHIGGMLKVLNNPLQHQITEIEKVYNYALSNSIEHMFNPGDLSHTPELTDTELIALIALFLKYDEHINSYYIAGNHDVESVKASSLDLLETIVNAGLYKRLKIYKKPTVETIDGVNVVFMPFPHLTVPRTKRPPLVFAHIETAGAIGDNGRPLKTGNDEKFKRQKGDFVISGHLHQYQYLKEKRILFGGSLYQTNFGESLPKSYMTISARYAEGKLKVNHSRIINKPNFVLETKIISSEDDWDQLSEEHTVRYRVLVEEGLVVPKKIAQQLKNIVSISGLNKSNKVAMEGIIDTEGKLSTANNLPTFKITTGLKKYAKEAGLTNEQLKKAQRWAKEAAVSLGIYGK